MDWLILRQRMLAAWRRLYRKGLKVQANKMENAWHQWWLEVGQLRNWLRFRDQP